MRSSVALYIRAVIGLPPVEWRTPRGVRCPYGRRTPWLVFCACLPGARGHQSDRAAHGARNVRVFGSVGRGEASRSSDLDLLVDMSEGRSLFDLVALGDDLEEALGVVVDVVTEKSLSPYLRDRILAEAVSL
ncbi:MAG: nucleotidyltransferase family protein [Actinobacteria bacterium]|nr:nucleotidyltransferase family protein [Actinomycetota bacterium]